jgi:glycosyltransferase involved in cell wall biosynthesis
MVEALACGTPVIAFPEGAAAEIVIDGENGMLVSDERQMAEAVQSLGSIDPQRCRASVAERYDVTIAVDRYERLYRRALAIHAGRATRRMHRSALRRPSHRSPPISRRR